MSFVRSSHHGQRKKKIIARKKPSWDDSVNDLSVYKPTQQELALRHAAHKSKNHMSIKLEKMRKAKQKNSSLSNAEARQMAIMKEVLYDQKQLQDTLSRSDKMMAVVKDLFGDDPRRFLGFPNVTSVPGPESNSQNKSGSIVAPVPDIRTRIETLSDSVMKQTALNDLSETESDDDVDAVEPIVYQPQMNLKRFQQFLAAEEERNQTLSSIGGQAQLSQNEVGPVQSTRLQVSQEETGYETPKKGHNESIEILRTPRSAINDTRKVKKTKKRVSPQKENRPQNTSALNLTDLRKVLGNLENEIEQYEKQTGRRPPAEKQRSETFSGYTVALVDSVSKLATYLRETDLRLQAEMTIREQLTQDVFQLRNIVDTLTSDIIVTQEEYSSVVTEFQRYRTETKEEIERLKIAVHGTSRLKTDRTEPATTQREERVNHESQKPKEMYPQPHGMQGEFDVSYSALPNHVSSHAVVLSPPVRKTRVTEEPEPQQLPQSKGQTSLIDFATLAESGSHSNTKSSQPYRPDPLPPPPQQVATVSVPRPTPLVQSNLPSGGLASSGAQVQSLAMPGQIDLPVSEQIAELNRQHEEAQKRLQLLFQQQEQQHMQMVIQQQHKYQRQQQQQSHRYQQQQQEQQQQQHSQRYQQQQQEQQQEQHHFGTSRPAMYTVRPGLEQGVHGLDSRGVSQSVYYQQSTSPPRHDPAQGSLSPPISPISTRSENTSVLKHLQKRHYGGGNAGREITVNLPVMDLETSAGSLPSPKTISPAH